MGTSHQPSWVPILAWIFAGVFGCATRPTPLAPPTPPIATEPTGFEVRVVLEDGVTPVEGCRIAVYVESHAGGALRSKLTRTLIAEDASDATGAARFDAIEPGRYAVAAGLVGAERGIVDFVTVSEDPDSRSHVFEIRALADVVGRAVRDGRPLRRAKFKLGSFAEDKTDAEGIYAFRGLALRSEADVMVWWGENSKFGIGNGPTKYVVVRLDPGVNEVKTLELPESAFSRVFTWNPGEGMKEEELPQPGDAR
jgi:hypothetical protein